MIINRNRGSGKETVTWNQCQQAVRNYLDQVTYDPSNYSTSRIAEFAPATAVQSNTKPIGKTVDGVTYYNNVPNVDTPFSSENIAGTLKPLDRLRWINTNAVNVRDLGGWQCDGGTVKYGMMLRGGQCSAADRQALVDECGVGVELSLLGSGETIEQSVLGTSVTKFQFGSYAWYTIAEKEIWKKTLRVAFDCALSSTPMYFHCTAGRDRTGTFAVIIEALLGVSQSDIDKDFELTNFSLDHYSAQGTNQWVSRADNYTGGYGGLINEIRALSIGTTFEEKVINWVASLGFTEVEINNFRKAMIDGNPQTVSLDIDEYNITKSGSNYSVSNDAASVKQYQDYVTEITADSGYIITDITVTEDGVDITKDCFLGDFSRMEMSTLKKTEHLMLREKRAQLLM